MISPVEQEQTSAREMYRAIVGIGAMCALVIVGVFQGTAARIADNQDRFLAGAIGEVLPVTVETLAVDADAAGRLVVVKGPTAMPVFLAYDTNGNLAGAVLTGIGMGYQDNIRVLFSYSFERQAIVGFKILDSKETPGLGDKIEKDPGFLANFEELDVALAASGEALSHAVITVKQGAKTQPWEVDGITGATISSRSVTEIVNRTIGDVKGRLTPETIRFYERQL